MQQAAHAKRSFRPLFIALIAALTAILLGCGETNRDEIESTLKSFNSALAESDGERACELLTEPTRVEIERRGDCAKLATRLSRSGGRTAHEIKALALGKVSDLTVEGTIATAKVQAPGGYPARSVELEETEGTWQISETPLGP